jgi:hypothetical protein
MEASLDLARQLLRSLLSSGPKYGAGLKIQLAREFERLSGVPFRSIERQFPKFSAFLAANSDLVEVVRPDSVGDVTVHLKAAPHADDGTRLSRLPTDLWHAFSNPDQRRRRYLNRATGRVVHFLPESEDDLDRRLAAEVSGDKNYVEVAYPTAFRQSSWMHEFLGSTNIPDQIRATCTHLANVPYSSSVNTAFTIALREYGTTYRHFRFSRVMEAVKEWAERHGVDLVLDMFTAATSEIRPPAATAPTTLIPGPVADEHAPASDARKQLHALIDLLDEQELSHVLIPLSSISRLAKKRP